MQRIKKHAHGYQKDAIRFGLKHKSVYYALDMGLGKTLIALAIIRLTKTPAIVFAPLKPIYNTWPEEIEKWVPGLTYDIIHGPNKHGTLRSSTADVLLINYDGLQWFFNNANSLAKNWKKRTLVLDESSMVKNPSTKRFKMLKKMDMLWSPYKMCLSATPAPNGYHELWSQYFVLDRGLRLGKAFGRFRDNYFHYTGPPLYKTTLRKGADTAITKVIKPITYRLDADDYLKMPEYIYNTITLKLSNDLFTQYKLLEDQFFLEFGETSSTALSAAALGMKLRQFVQGALYLDDTKGDFQEIHTLKAEALAEILETATSPILCPIQFKFDLKMIHKHISKDIPWIAGGVTTARANLLIKEWNKGSLPILLCHPLSISHGTNLQTGGHNLLWYALTWSLEQYMQLNGRLRRQGQLNESVTVSHLAIKNTKDEDVAKAISKKDATQKTLLEALKRGT